MKRPREDHDYCVGRYPSYRAAPIPMCFTWEALDALLRSVGASRPETGAKGFGPLDRMGFDTIEFDESGSRQAGGAVYAPDAVWGQRRQEYWLRQSDDTAKLWTGDLHSHPGSFGFPSGKAGPGLGDLGYVEEVFRQNETMQYFLLPILTHTGTDAMPTIHPWVVSRDNPHQPLIAKLQVCDSTADFPLRVFNPEWEQRIALAPVLVTPSLDELETLDPSVAVYNEAVIPSPALRIMESASDISAAPRLMDTVPTVLPLERGLAATAPESLDTEAPNYCATVPSAPDAVTVGEGMAIHPAAHFLPPSVVAPPPRRNRRLKQRQGRHTSSWHRSHSSPGHPKA